ncbi:hypothetical protein [Nocardia sp. GAS34]|uniref:hypothetical protein n=1 Tax=unclassified Nocardia TaxID=2637762 RepID=UPI003D1E5380
MSKVASVVAIPLLVSAVGAGAASASPAIHGPQPAVVAAASAPIPRAQDIADRNPVDNGAAIGAGVGAILAIPGFVGGLASGASTGAAIGGALGTLPVGTLTVPGAVIGGIIGAPIGGVLGAAAPIIGGALLGAATGYVAPQSIPQVLP